MWLELKQKVQRAALTRGLIVRGLSSRSSHEALFRALSPVKTEHDLIRIGGQGDGGYLVPDDLEGIEACFSPGVDLEASFEQQMIDRGLRTFQIDASVIDTPLKHSNNEFERRFLGVFTDELFITLDDWVEQKMPGTSDLILQIDIEGAEYLTLAQVSEKTLKRFRIIVLELHFLDHAFEKFGNMMIVPVIERLRKYYDVVHLHPNNYAPLSGPSKLKISATLEVTLLRHDRSKNRGKPSNLTHRLDVDNVPTKPTIKLLASAFDLR